MRSRSQQLILFLLGHFRAMPHVFHLNKEALKRRFAVYVVIARNGADTKLYVGKTGDNREGCNPVISRCGNHFSYNRIHSQLRNKLADHEARDYTYVFEHFDDYHEDLAARRVAINRINEIERSVNTRIADLVRERRSCTLLNPFTGRGHVREQERQLRETFRTPETSKKIDALIQAVESELERWNPLQHVAS